MSLIAFFCNVNKAYLWSFDLVLSLMVFDGVGVCGARGVLDDK